MTCKPRTWVLYARWRLSHGQLEPADPTNFLRELGVEPADAMRGYEGWSKHLEEVVRLSTRRPANCLDLRHHTVPIGKVSEIHRVATLGSGGY